MKRFLLVIAMICIVSPSSLRAEYPHTRESGVIGLSFGFGNGGADLTIVEDVDRRNGFTGSFRLGFVVNPKWVGTFEATGWRTIDGSDVWQFAFLGGAATFYPDAEKGAFLKGGLGWGATTVVQNRDLPTERRFQDRAGVGFLIGGGYEFRIAENVSLGPSLQWVYINANGDVTKRSDFFSVFVDLAYHY